MDKVNTLIWLKVLTLERKTYVERTEKQLHLDDDNDEPNDLDDILDNMRNNLFSDNYNTENYNYHTVNEEMRYEYWCCGHWRYPTETVEHIEEKHING